jgi:cytidylate kinase
MAYFIILSGEACTGKTTVGLALAARLGCVFQSAGNHARAFARERYQLDVHKFQDLCAADPEIDRLLDEAFRQDIRANLDRGLGMVVDFRMGAHFFTTAMSIYLKASPAVVIRRLAGRGDEVFSQLLERNVKARQRLSEIYGYDYTVEANYRHVIDTDELTAVQIVEQIQTDFGLPRL